MNIFLEFVPGGSISLLHGKFGSFPEYGCRRGVRLSTMKETSIFGAYLPTTMARSPLMVPGSDLDGSVAPITLLDSMRLTYITLGLNLCAQKRFSISFATVLGVLMCISLFGLCLLSDCYYVGIGLEGYYQISPSDWFHLDFSLVFTAAFYDQSTAAAL